MCRFDETGLCKTISEYIWNFCGRESVVGWVTARQIWKRNGQVSAVADRQPSAVALPCFSNFNCRGRISFVVKNAQGTWLVKFIFRVATPVPDCQIDFAVSIKIPRRNAAPATVHLGKSPLRGNVFERAVI